MNATTASLHADIYPALYEVLPSALPEFDFKLTGQGYKSTTTLKITGETDGDSTGKVYVYEDKPHLLKDWRGGSLTMWDYIKERDGLEDKGAIYRRLAELANVQLPERQLSADELERIQLAKRVSDAWEAANDFFIECLSLKTNQYANTTRAKEVQSYLVNERGYSPGLFRLSGYPLDRDTPKMEVGYMPGMGELATHLRDKEFTQDEINVIVKSVGHAGLSIGTQNILTFPYRDHFGRIRGMVFRAIRKDDPYKYLYSEFKRGEVLFNLRSLSKDKDLVIVEAPLDSMHAAALGIKNVVALGGSGTSINPKQIDLAVKYGVEKITLMLDNDSEDGVERAGIKGTDHVVAFLQKEYPRIRVYIGSYPAGIKDLDELLVKQGVEVFNKIKIDAIPAWLYIQNRILARYEKEADPETDELSLKQIDDLRLDLIAAASKLSPLDRDPFTETYLRNPELQKLGITKESADAMAAEMRRAAFNKEQSNLLQDLLKKAKIEGESGDITKALDLLQKDARDIKARNKEDSFAELSAIVGEQQVRDRIKNRPEPLESGFELAGEPLMIPAAAITMFAAGTSHGKSIMLANLAINMAELYPEKNFHIFSYEVDEDQYLINLINPYVGVDDLCYSNRDSILADLKGKTSIRRRDLKDLSKMIELKLWKGDDKKKEVFETKKAEFFRDLIDKGRIKIHYVTHDSDTLIDAIRHLNKTEPLGAVLIDYIQLIDLPIGKLKNASRQEQVKRMCQDFKDLFNETGLPLIFAAQFNRDIQGPFDMHATKLGEAGDLERIASLVVAIWNNSREWDYPKKEEAQEKIKAKVPFVFDQKEKINKPDPKTWSVKVLKRRTGRVEVWDIWNYLPNAGKVSSNS